MAVRSRDLVGIAEGIRSHELSTRGQIENLKGHISELSGRKSSLNSKISYLEATIAAVYENTDDDGEPDYGLLAILESERISADNELWDVEQDLDSSSNELESKQEELEDVEEEKAQTLFEIQERARKTSQNISLAGGMYGAYSGVGVTLKNSLQTSLSSLTQAAGILGGHVDGGTGGRSGSATSGRSGTASRGIDITTGNENKRSDALIGFTGGYSGESLPLSASQFNTEQDQFITPATTLNYHSGQTTLNTKPLNDFSTKQDTNEYILSSFGNVTISQNEVSSANLYNSDQTSQNLENQFLSEVVADNINKKHTFVDWLNPAKYKDSHYIGTGQVWGYKPYGNDASEYETKIITSARQALNSYMQEHNYGVWDYGSYSKDPLWQKLHKAAYPASKVENNIMTPQEKLQQYMYKHNYGWDDYIIYSRDPEWKRLSKAIHSSGLSGNDKYASANLHYMKIPEDIFYAGEKTRSGADDFFGNIFTKIKTVASSLKVIPLKKRYNLLRNTDTENVSRESLYALTALATDILKKNFGNVLTKERFQNLSKDIILLSKEEIEELYPKMRNNIAGFYSSETQKIVIKTGSKIPIGRFLHTYVHEMIHKLSHGKENVGLIETEIYLVKKITKNDGLNEGITELYACRAMESVIPNYFAESYPEEKAIVERLESIYGKKELLEVFLQGRIEELRKDFDSCFGENGKFDEFSNLVDEINMLVSMVGKKSSSPKVANRISKVFRILDEYEKLKQDSNYKFRVHQQRKINSVNVISNNTTSSSKNEDTEKGSKERVIWKERDENNR